MSSLVTPNPFAIRLQHVSKIYKLHGSQGDQLIDVLGLQRFGFKTKTPSKEFSALSNISLEVPRGHRIGIIGRNGAGKTTLLKLICGNFAPTSGEVEVHGTVQALMNIGLGFHPEYTGRENVEASLQYNGLARDEYHKAMEGIVEFCELGDFLDQPFKTYSLGMQARLMFAAATAIKPDILIVDEVLGAGDAYFIAKSKARVEKLVHSGCTMLLVSHSIQQVLELCDEAVWLDQGRIRMQGKAFLVVKAYEEYLFGVVKPSHQPYYAQPPGNQPEIVEKQKEASHISFENVGVQCLQEPTFIPHDGKNDFPKINISELEKFPFQAPGGLSRWQAEEGVKICGFGIKTVLGLTNRLTSLCPAKIVIALKAEHQGTFECRYGIVIDDLQGRNVTKIFSPIDLFDIENNGIRLVELELNPLQIGPGEYTIGISILGNSTIEMINQAKRYDLLGRSFEFSVDLPSSLAALTTNYFHSAAWTFMTGYEISSK